jgi:hypothetical protein
MGGEAGTGMKLEEELWRIVGVGCNDLPHSAQGSI